MADKKPLNVDAVIQTALGVIVVAYIVDMWSHGALTARLRGLLAAPVAVPTVRDEPAGMAEGLRDIYDSTRGEV